MLIGYKSYQEEQAKTIYLIIFRGSSETNLVKILYDKKH
jgi:hypothetical protein